MPPQPAKPFFHIILGDRDLWAVEAEWPDGTLERVRTFRDRSLATDWIAFQSELWVRTQKIFHDE
jgi:hypothetical protein